MQFAIFSSFFNNIVFRKKGKNNDCKKLRKIKKKIDKISIETAIAVIFESKYGR